MMLYIPRLELDYILIQRAYSCSNQTPFALWVKEITNLLHTAQTYLHNFNTSIIHWGDDEVSLFVLKDQLKSENLPWLFYCRHTRTRPTRKLVGLVKENDSSFRRYLEPCVSIFF